MPREVIAHEIIPAVRCVLEELGLLLSSEEEEKEAAGEGWY
jgi:hypothetical protein